MPHAIFIVVSLMMVGYLFVEFARYSRARSDDGPTYPVERLVLRFSNGLLLLFLLGVLLFAPTPFGQDPITRYGMPAAMVLLFILVWRDISGVKRQYQREAKAREQQFLRELERTVRRKRP